jgi:hypothetical protein
MVDKSHAIRQCITGLNGEHARPDENPGSHHKEREQDQCNKPPASFLGGR